MAAVKISNIKRLLKKHIKTTARNMSSLNRGSRAISSQSLNNPIFSQARSSVPCTPASLAQREDARKRPRWQHRFCWALSAVNPNTAGLNCINSSVVFLSKYANG
jgi:hypothetical protein